MERKIFQTTAGLEVLWGGAHGIKTQTGPLFQQNSSRKQIKAFEMSLTSFAPSREAADLDQEGSECHPDTERHRERDYIGF